MLKRLQSPQAQLCRNFCSITLSSKPSIIVTSDKKCNLDAYADHLYSGESSFCLLEWCSFIKLMYWGRQIKREKKKKREREWHNSEQKFILFIDLFMGVYIGIHDRTGWKRVRKKKEEKVKWEIQWQWIVKPLNNSTENNKNKSSIRKK